MGVSMSPGTTQLTRTLWDGLNGGGAPASTHASRPRKRCWPFAFAGGLPYLTLPRRRDHPQDAFDGPSAGEMVRITVEYLIIVFAEGETVRPFPRWRTASIAPKWLSAASMAALSCARSDTSAAAHAAVRRAHFVVAP